MSPELLNTYSLFISNLFIVVVHYTNISTRTCGVNHSLVAVVQENFTNQTADVLVEDKLQLPLDFVILPGARGPQTEQQN